MTTDQETFGQRLSRLRQARGLSQRTLHAEGVSNSYIARLELDQRSPSPTALRNLAAALGVSEHYLATGDEAGAWVYLTWEDLARGADVFNCPTCDTVLAENGPSREPEGE